jgi:nicotinamidase-related amidase
VLKYDIIIKNVGGYIMKFLIVVDMQVDFISGSLGSEQAKAIVPHVLNKVKSFDGNIIFTRDTHFTDYLETQEGKNLPVPHCIKDSDGWQICDELKPYTKSVLNKSTFGYTKLADFIRSTCEAVESIELCGLCTDICVISNAIILKNEFPEAKIIVDSSCSAGVTIKSHNTALNAMRAVQIQII